jgi:hypothetical protein
LGMLPGGCHGWGCASGLQAMEARRPRDCRCGAGCTGAGVQANWSLQIAKILWL